MKCLLCDKPVDKSQGVTVVGKQSGQEIHGDCYRTWLVEKMRGKDT